MSVIQAQQIELSDFRTLGQIYKDSDQHFLSYIYNSSFYFLSSKNAVKLKAGLDAVNSCLLYNRHIEAEILLKDIYSTFPEYQNEIQYYYFYLMTSMKFFDRNLLDYSQIKGFNNRKSFLNAYLEFHENEIDKSINLLNDIDSVFKYYNDVNLLKDQLRSKPKYNKKFKTISLLFSTFLPGLGQFYCGSSFDALNSFAFNFVTGIGTYSAWKYEFSKNENKRTYILPIISSIIFSSFYVTNLYNSVNLAEKSNLYQESKYYDSLLEKFNVIISDKEYFIMFTIPIE